MIKIYAMGVLKLNFSPNPYKYIEDSRLWALYTNFEKAEAAILNNSGDIFEVFYNVACIEEHYILDSDDSTLEYHLPRQWWYQAKYSGNRNPTVESMFPLIPEGMLNTSNIWIG
jgi:hypothetical protein